MKTRRFPIRFFDFRLGGDALVGTRVLLLLLLTRPHRRRRIKLL